MDSFYIAAETRLPNSAYFAFSSPFLSFSKLYIFVRSVLNWVPDGVRCKPNYQPIECKFVVVNSASSAILEDIKRIDSLTLFICHFFTRNEAFRGIPNARATKPRHTEKVKVYVNVFTPPSLINAIILVVRSAIESQCVSGLLCHSYFY